MIAPYAPDRTPARARGFTLIELLLAIAIISMLMSIVLVALRSAHGASERTRTFTALRQMAMGYAGYSTEHDGRLLPGYVKSTSIGNGESQLALTARLRSGYELEAADTSSYVWRLAPYLDHHWLTYMTDYQSPQVESRFDSEYGDGSAGGAYGPGSINPAKQLGIGFTPSIGLNSIYVGGDNFHGNIHTPSYNPWFRDSTRIAAVRASEVANPAKLIVFAPTRAVNVVLPEAGVQLGYVELRAPFLPGSDPEILEESQWTVDADGRLQTNSRFFNGIGGLMHDRGSAAGGADNVPVAHFDGSTIVHNPIEFIVDPAITDHRSVALERQRIMSWWAAFTP